MPYVILYFILYFKIHSTNSIKECHLQFHVLYFTLPAGDSLRTYICPTMMTAHDILPTYLNSVHILNPCDSKIGCIRFKCMAGVANSTVLQSFRPAVPFFCY
jgi:hypothetical protein